MTHKRLRARVSRRSDAASLERLAKLGTGTVAYVKKMTVAEANELCARHTKGEEPLIDLPEDAEVYMLIGADGALIMATDSPSMAIGHAKAEELTVACVH